MLLLLAAYSCVVLASAEAVAKRGVASPKRTAEDEAIQHHADIVLQIDEMAAFQEDAIRERDAKLWLVFDRMRGDVWTFREGKMGGGLTFPPEVRRYMLSSSFMAAGFAIEGNKARRDDLAQSFAILVSRLGCDPQECFIQHAICEKEWVTQLRRTDLFSSNSRYCLPCVILVSLPILIVILLVIWK